MGGYELGWALLRRPVVPQNTAAYRKADAWGRASPAECADEDVHNPSKEELRYESGMWVLQRSETAATKLVYVIGAFWNGIQYDIEAI